MNNRWQRFRSEDNSIPTTPIEAAVFLSDAGLHLRAYGFSTYDARLILNDAHGEVNKNLFPSTEVAA